MATHICKYVDRKIWVILAVVFFVTSLLPRYVTCVEEASDPSHDLSSSSTNDRQAERDGNRAQLMTESQDSVGQVPPCKKGDNGLHCHQNVIVESEEDSGSIHYHASHNEVLDAYVPESGKDISDTENTPTDQGDDNVEVTRANEILSEESASEDEEKSQGSPIMNFINYFLDPVLEEFREDLFSSNSSNSNSTTETSTVIPDNASKLENVSQPEFLNLTDVDEGQNGTDPNKKVKFHCVGRNLTDNSTVQDPIVKIVNSTRLLQMLSFEKNDTENLTDCIIVMFYAPWCHFCAQTAPHYNALARAYPQLDVLAVDTAQFSNLLARFGTVSVPNILIFHQSKAAVKFNQTARNFENFVTFVRNTTGLEPNITVNVTSEDYLGPLSSTPTENTDYLLWLAWLFVVVCGSTMFVQSSYGQHWINRITILWQEHQHID